MWTWAVIFVTELAAITVRNLIVDKTVVVLKVVVFVPNTQKESNIANSVNQR